jgi:hypothetical protein
MKEIPLTTAEVAELLDVTPGRVRQLRTQGSPPRFPSSFTTGSGQHMYWPKDVRKFLRKREASNGRGM